MEYYILKLYQREKEKNVNVEQGFNRFAPKTKRVIIGCLIIMFLSYAQMLLTIFVFPKKLWYLVGLFVSIIALLILMRIDTTEQKKHMEKYVDSHKKKIDILCNLLSKEFHINSKEKVEELIDIYQAYVDKKNKEEKSRNGIILTLFSVFAGVLTISFDNMNIIGLDFTNWLYLAIFLLVVVSGAGLWIYSYRFFESLKKKYEMMIKDLKDLQLIKY